MDTWWLGVYSLFCDGFLFFNKSTHKVDKNNFYLLVYEFSHSISIALISANSAIA